MLNRRRKGFTLVETIAAIVILAVALPPMLWAIRDAHVQRVNPVLASRARWLAVEKLEDIIADRHSASRGWDYLIAANYPPEPAVAGYAQFARAVTFNETGPDLVSSGTGYMTISVQVAWVDALGETRSLVVDSVVTEYTP